jgi:hypothetical protein
MTTIGVFGAYSLDMSNFDFYRVTSGYIQSAIFSNDCNARRGHLRRHNS